MSCQGRPSAVGPVDDLVVDVGDVGGQPHVEPGPAQVADEHVVHERSGGRARGAAGRTPSGRTGRSTPCPGRGARARGPPVWRCRTGAARPRTGAARRRRDGHAGSAPRTAFGGARRRSMARMGRIPDKPTLDGIEAGWSDRWEADGTYRFDRTASRRATCSRSTRRRRPCPGSIHMGTVFGYTQTDAIARYQRMAGKAVFFPIGWDDNGLATERRVQNFYGVRCDPSAALRPRLPAAVPRRHAEGPPRDPDLAAQLRRALPRADRHRRGRVRGPLPSPRAVLRLVAASTRRSTTSAGAPRRRRSSTTSPAARRTAPRRRRSGTSTTAPPSRRPRSRTVSGPAPTTCWRSARPDGGDLLIDTTRPELVVSCVALVAHPDDERYAPLDRHDRAHAGLRRRGAGRRPPTGPARQGHRHRDGLHVRRHHRRDVVARARPADAQRHRARRPHRRRRRRRGWAPMRRAGRLPTSSPGSP